LSQGQPLDGPAPEVIELTGELAGVLLPDADAKAALTPPSVAIIGAAPPVKEEEPTSENETPREVNSSSIFEVRRLRSG
jgi:hypothetical protein